LEEVANWTLLPIRALFRPPKLQHRLQANRNSSICCGLKVRAPLFSDAELAKDHVEEVFGGGFADDFADGVDGDAEVEGDEFEGLIGAEGVECADGGGAGAVEGVLVAGVDHDFEHLGFDFARPDEGFDGVFEGVEALTGQAREFDAFLIL